MPDAIAQPVTRVVDAKGIPTAVTRAGEENRDVALLIHGSGPGATGFSSWRYLLAPFAQRYRCLAPDLAGFGRSHHPSPPIVGVLPYMRLWVEQMLGLLDAEGIDRAHVVGNSLGGAIAINLAIRAPERFDRIILMGPVGAPCTLTPELNRVWGFFEEHTFAAMAELYGWFVQDSGSPSKDMLAVVEERYHMAMDENVRRSFENMFPRPRQQHLDDVIIPPAALRRLKHPVLIVHGSDDRIVPMDTSLYFLQHLPRVQVHLVGGCSHGMNVERRDSFSRLVSDFLGGHI